MSSTRLPVSLDTEDDDLPPDLEDASDLIRSSRIAASSSSTVLDTTQKDKSSLLFLDSSVSLQSNSDKKSFLPGQSLAMAALPDSMKSQLREEEERRKAAEDKAIASVASPSRLTSEETTLGLEMLEAGRAAAATADRERRAKEIVNSKNFGAGTAIKKGFLLGGNSSETKKANTVLSSSSSSLSSSSLSSSSSSSSLVTRLSSVSIDDEIVRPKGGAVPAGFLPEVQDALRAQGGPSAMQAKLDKERGKWMTPELIERVKKEPRLLAGMQNPRFMQALSELGSDPKAAFEKYKKDEGVQDFLRTFMGIMGSHFEDVAATEDIQKQYDGVSSGNVSSSGSGLTPIASRTLPYASSSQSAALTKTNTTTTTIDKNSFLDPAVSSDDIAKAAKDGQLGVDDVDARRVLSNKELVDILRDPLIMRVLEECKQDGRNLYKYMQVPAIRAKLRVMERNGLIRLEGM